MIAPGYTVRRAILAMLLVSSLAGPCHSRTTHVHIDTSRWLHHQGYLLFTYVTSIPESVALNGENRICVRNLRHDGQMGEGDAAGGISSSIYEPFAVQPFTWVIDPDDVPDALGGKGRYRHNQFQLNFAKRYALDPDALWLGNFIDFDLELPDLGYLPVDGPPDAFTITFLNRDGVPAMPTADPLGGNALIACAPQRGTRGWRVEAFAPARFGNLAGMNETIVIALQDPPLSAGKAVHPIHVPPEIRSVGRQNGVVWIEYAIPLPMSHVVLSVIDGKGNECYRRDIGKLPPGIYGNEWPERGGPAPAPGRYRVILRADERQIEKSVDL